MDDRAYELQPWGPKPVPEKKAADEPQQGSAQADNAPSNEGSDDLEEPGYGHGV